MSMVERVALAILTVRMDEVAEAKKCMADPHWRFHALNEARAAIAALREPTDEMKGAGANSYGLHTPHIGPLPIELIDGQPTKAWQAMIDEALK